MLLIRRYRQWHEGNTIRNRRDKAGTAAIRIAVERGERLGAPRHNVNAIKAYVETGDRVRAVEDNASAAVACAGDIGEGDIRDGDAAGLMLADALIAAVAVVLQVGVTGQSDKRRV